jgi:peptidylprolyl isomerase
MFRKFFVLLAFLILSSAAFAEDAKKPAEPAKQEEVKKEDAKTEEKKSEEPAKSEEKKTDETKTETKEGDVKTENKNPEEKKDAAATTGATSPLEDTIYLDLKDGRVVIKLLPEIAPKHVARIKELARQNFYDNSAFHRVIEGFMAQTGDPTGTGRGGSGKNIEAEFSNMKHVKGTVAMARANDPNSADSQFFICFDDAPHLDGQYTIFGTVTEGIEFVDKIKKGFGPNGRVVDPDKIIKMRVAADVPADDVWKAPEGATPAATDAVAPAAGEKAPEAAKDAAPATDAKSGEAAKELAKTEEPAKSEAKSDAKKEDNKKQ